MSDFSSKYTEYGMIGNDRTIEDSINIPLKRSTRIKKTFSMKRKPRKSKPKTTQNIMNDKNVNSAQISFQLSSSTISKIANNPTVICNERFQSKLATIDMHVQKQMEKNAHPLAHESKHSPLPTHNNMSDSLAFQYSSHFSWLSLIGWYHHCIGDASSINGDLINQMLFKEYNNNLCGVLLLPDIESCYDAKCRGLYLNSHKKFICNCLLKKMSWSKNRLSYMKSYEEITDDEITSCPVPQFTFQNRIGLFGSPVMDSGLIQIKMEGSEDSRRLNMSNIECIVQHLYQRNRK